MMLMNGEGLIRGAFEEPVRQPDGVIITPSADMHISYDKIPTTRRPRSVANIGLEKWVPRDFVTYTIGLHKRYGVQWNLRYPASCLEIQRIHDSIVDVLGFCDNSVLKSYIDFFFANYADSFMKQRREFYFSFLMKESILKKFAESYVAPQVSNLDLPGKIDNSSVTYSDIESAFLIGYDRLLMSYGIILSVNWLELGGKSVDIRKRVLDACLQLHKKGKFGIVVESTNKYSPYPNWLEFVHANHLLKLVSSDYLLDVEFTSNNRFEFLRKKQ